MPSYFSFWIIFSFFNELFLLTKLSNGISLRTEGALHKKSFLKNRKNIPDGCNKESALILYPVEGGRF